MNQKELARHLITIEKLLWTNDAVIYKENYTDNAILVFPETGTISIETALMAILEENKENRKWAEVNFSDIQCNLLTDNLALLTYKVIARWAHELKPIVALASSIYINKNGRWLVLFHQQSSINNEK